MAAVDEEHANRQLTTDRALVVMLRAIVVSTALIVVGIIVSIGMTVNGCRVSRAEHADLVERVKALEQLLEIPAAESPAREPR